MLKIKRIKQAIEEGATHLVFNPKDEREFLKDTRFVNAAELKDGIELRGSPGSIGALEVLTDERVTEGCIWVVKEEAIKMAEV